MITSTLENGWILYEKPADGFAIALPPTWKQIDLNPELLGASLDAVKRQFPELGSSFEGQIRVLIAAGIKFFALDLAPESLKAGYPTSVNIVRGPLLAKLPLDFYMQAAAGQLESLSTVIKPVSQRHVKFPAGEAGELRYSVKATQPTGQVVTVSTTQYLLLTENYIYVISFGTTADQAKRYAPIFEKMGQSFQLPKFVCKDELGCVDIAPDATIHIAYMLVIAGPNAPLGIDSRRGIEMAIDDKGQILGHKIELTGEDSGCSAQGGLAAATRLAADPTIVAVIGTSCSSEARVAVPLFSKAGFVIISPSNTAPDLTEKGNPNNHPGYLRTAHNDEVQGATAAKFAWEFLKVKAAATIHDGSLYADKLQQAFADSFRQLGGTITAQEAVDPNQTDMHAVLTRIAAGKPDMIYFPIFLPAGGFIIRQAKETAGLENTVLMGADGLFSPDVVKAAGDAVQGFYVSSPFISSPAYDGFVKKYEYKYGQEPISIFHAHAYDAFMMIAAAIERVAVKDPDGTLHIGRKALRDALYATKDFTGLTGNLTCNDTGDCADPHIAVYEYFMGEYPPKQIWPQS